MEKGPISSFITHHFRHFNAATLVDAAEEYCNQLESGHKMMITLAGTMSTAELGVSLAEMIRQDKVQIISCTGANLEEDLMNLVAHEQYVRIPDYRNLNSQQEEELLRKGLNRVTDTCIPEEEAFRKLEHHLLDLWDSANENNLRYFPHEYMYQLISSETLKEEYQIDPKDSWLVAACEKNIPVIVPGWEDSTIGNIFTSHCINGRFKPSLVKSGIEYMVFLTDWYENNADDHGIGFFQIGGGIAGDFPICVVPMMKQDLGKVNTPSWSYFCQISDSTTSYGSYSGAVPNEKITWGKIEES